LKMHALTSADAAACSARLTSGTKARSHLQREPPGKPLMVDLTTLTLSIPGHRDVPGRGLNGLAKGQSRPFAACPDWSRYGRNVRMGGPASKQPD
jgi:hypothetical protein